MNAKALNSLADLICRAQESGRRTPMGIAMAIDAAGRHMSPETAAELERLREQVTKLEANKGDLRWLVGQLQARVDVLERLAAGGVPEPEPDGITRRIAPVRALHDENLTIPTEGPR